MSCYLDASVLLSLFIEDALSERIDAWFLDSKEPLIVSRWATIEFVSVVHRRSRGGEFAPEIAERYCVLFERWRNEMTERVEIDPAAGVLAESLCAQTSLMLAGGDALHLALAMSNSAPIVTTDLRLAEAARARRHPCIVP